MKLNSEKFPTLFKKSQQLLFGEQTKGMWTREVEGWGGYLLVQTNDHSGVNQHINSGTDEKLESFLIYSEDRDPTRFTERLNAGCVRNYASQGFWPEQLGKCGANSYDKLGEVLGVDSRIWL